MIKNEEEEEVKKTEIKKKLLGFFVIDLKPFMDNSKLKVVEKKYKLFEYEDENIFRNHEIFWPLRGEEIVLEKMKERIEGLRKEKYTFEEKVKNILLIFFKGRK